MEHPEERYGLRPYMVCTTIVQIMQLELRYRSWPLGNLYTTFKSRCIGFCTVVARKRQVVHIIHCLPNLALSSHSCMAWGLIYESIFLLYSKKILSVDFLLAPNYLWTHVHHERLESWSILDMKVVSLHVKLFLGRIVMTSRKSWSATWNYRISDIASKRSGPSEWKNETASTIVSFKSHVQGLQSLDASHL